MKKIFLAAMLFIVSGSASATEAPYQLSGSILITNPGANRTVGQWNIEYNHRHPSYAACEAARQAALSQEIEVMPEFLLPHYGVTNGKVNKISHLSCLPVSAL